MQKSPWVHEINSQVATSNQHRPEVDVYERSTVSKTSHVREAAFARLSII
jgi:hypothetical protein